ncbi:acyl-CoA synthetase [Streptomyces griseoviridis]|uniref:Acyl-CoA synthetase n=1 Tax=Streptomyces griseoviridis TaxID=45398 RepID=A0A918LCH5_STRGD|nr:acyl-CoA synthetase [Streptomyces niveoruber]
MVPGTRAPPRPPRVPRTLARVNATDRTPADLLSSALAADPGRPLVTFYDDATGERVELSVATFANWVAKTANLLQDELSAEPGDRVALLLPAHWQTAVWLLACASVGAVADVAGDPAAADVVVSGPDSLEAARACSGARIALALRPLGGRFPRPPEGFADYAVEVPGQGDRFVPYAPVDPEEPALIVAGREFSGAEVVERARAEAAALGLTGPGARLLSGLPYDTWEGLNAGLYGPLATGGSVVLCRNLDRLAADALDRRIESERVTATAR